jgi:hypothetical protein
MLRRIFRYQDLDPVLLPPNRQAKDYYPIHCIAPEYFRSIKPQNKNITNHPSFKVYPVFQKKLVVLKVEDERLPMTNLNSKKSFGIDNSNFTAILLRNLGNFFQYNNVK